MQAVILAAGRGKRMNNLTTVTTKPMLKIKGKPLLEHKINALPKKIKEVIFVVGYYSEHVLSHFKRYYNGRRITYVFQSSLNGTGGAIHLARMAREHNVVVEKATAWHPIGNPDDLEKAGEMLHKFL